MANISSQEKRIRRSERERLENRRYVSAARTYFRRLRQALADGDREQAAAAYRSLVSQLDRAAAHGALHRNNVARKKSQAAKLMSGS